MMIALDQGIAWGADVVMMQEPVVENEGYNISHPGYRLVMGKRVITRIRSNTQLEFTEVEMVGEGHIPIIAVNYPFKRKMGLVIVYDQLRQEGGSKKLRLTTTVSKIESNYGAAEYPLVGRLECSQ
jgi:hypothetical protein